jgi:hypothetical protein
MGGDGGTYETSVNFYQLQGTTNQKTTIITVTTIRTPDLGK